MELIPVSGFSLISLLRGFLGISVLILIAFLLSNNRKAISWKTVGVGLFIQFIVAFGVLKVKLIKNNPSWLVTSVKVGKNSQEFKLLFIEDKIENENYQNKAEFVLAIPNLRQWLNALFKIYLKANWDTKFFPVWIDTDMSLSEEKPILN